jgi:hypothetical protein
MKAWNEDGITTIIWEDGGYSLFWVEGIGAKWLYDDTHGEVLVNTGPRS